MINDENKRELVCVYSLPRSGSTAFLAELDKWKGVICLPESYFPQILEYLSEEELNNPRTLAAYFLSSSPSGSLLSFEEAMQCMEPKDLRKTLINIGLSCAQKLGRSISDVKIIVWKTTRIIGRWELFSKCGGRFIVLRRNKYNIFESQFRVSFGVHNRNPFRFALFHESYEAVFQRLPEQQRFSAFYEDIPSLAKQLGSWLRVSGERRSDGLSSLASTHGKQEWHDGLLSDFNSMDEEKVKKVSEVQKISIELGCFVGRQFHWLLARFRDRYDFLIFKQVRHEALTGRTLSVEDTF
ncbi:MAG: hypothetical protein AAF541_01550 [Pseudomonadota bacterium]